MRYRRDPKVLLVRAGTQLEHARYGITWTKPEHFIQGKRISLLSFYSPEDHRSDRKIYYTTPLSMHS